MAFLQDSAEPALVRNRRFTFIDGISRSASTRKAARAHLRREKYQDHSRSKCSTTNCEDCREDDYRTSQRHMFTLVDGYAKDACTRKAVRSHLAQSKRALLTQNLGSGNSDPFAAAAMPITPTIHMYLIHYRKVTAMFTSPINASQMVDLVPILLSDALWLHSVAAVCAIDIANLTRMAGTFNVATTEHFQDYLSQKSKTISLLNKELADPENGTSDAAVFAVANLATAEATIGNFTEWEIHMTGLRWMVHLRGGLNRLNFHLAWFLSMVDIKLSLSSLCGTRFEGSIFNAHNDSRFSKIAFDKILNYTTIDPDLECMGAIFSDNREELSAFIHPQLFDVLASLKEVTVAWELSRHHRVLLTSAQAQALSIQELTVEYQLLNFPAKWQSETQKVFSQCVRLAAIAFVNTGVISNDPGAASNLSGLRRGLREAIGRVEHLLRVTATAPSLARIRHSSGACDPAPHQVLLWCLFLGANLSSGNYYDGEERGWFLPKISDCATELSLGSWAEIRSVLQDCFYTAQHYEEPFRKIWDESRGT